MPAPLRRAFAGEVRELGFALKAVAAGRDPSTASPVTYPDAADMVLGEDRANAQVAMRDKLRPMMAIFILMLGTIAIAGLVAVEIEHRTVTTMLVTPATSWDLLAMPSWGFTEAIVGLMGSGRTPSELLVPIGTCAAWTAGLPLSASLLLRRRVEAL